MFCDYARLCSHYMFTNGWTSRKHIRYYNIASKTIAYSMASPMSTLLESSLHNSTLFLPCVSFWMVMVVVVLLPTPLSHTHTQILGINLAYAVVMVLVTKRQRRRPRLTHIFKKWWEGIFQLSNSNQLRGLISGPLLMMGNILREGSYKYKAFSGTLGVNRMYGVCLKCFLLTFNSH